MTPSLEIPHDNKLPQMAVILDEVNMRGVLEDALNAEAPGDTPADVECSRLRVRHCKIEWIKYKPDSKCTVCYRLAIDPLPPDSQGELILYGRIYAAGGALSRFRRAQSACLVRPRFGRPLLHLPVHTSPGAHEEPGSAPPEHVPGAPESRPPSLCWPISPRVSSSGSAWPA